MREGAAAVGPLVAGPERLSARKMECSIGGRGGGSSGKLRVFESRKESKRRLVLSDSESEDLVSPLCRWAVAQAGSVGVKGNGSGGRKLGFEGFTKNGKRAGVTLKRVVQQDVVRFRRDSGIDLRSSARLGMERKRSWEAAANGGEDEEVSLKRIKRESLKCEKNKRGEKDVEVLRLDSVRCGVGKALARASHLPSPKQLMAAEEGDESLDKRMQVHLNGNRCLKDGRNRCLEHPNQKIYGLLKRNNYSPDVQRCNVSNDGGRFKFQGKGGVLRLLPGNKSSGPNIFCFGDDSDESRKNTRNSGGAYKSTFSVDIKSLKKSGSSSITNESRKNLQCSGGADQCRRHGSLSDDRKLLRKATCSSTTEESGKSSRHRSTADQSILKHLSLFKDRKVLKKQNSFPAKEENRKSPQHSAGAIQVKHRSTSENGMSLKKAGPSMPVASRKYRGRSSCSPTLSEDSESFKNPDSASIQRKSHVGLRGKSLELKKEADDLPLLSDSKLSEKLSKRTEVKEREASRFITKSHGVDNTTSEKASCRTEKQKLRDHIKSMLLSAGWRIDMRPRRGRNYEDAVYVSPQGTGYWSITKAYSVFQEQFDKKEVIENGEGEELHGQVSKTSSANAYNHNGMASQFSAIPSDMLEMLKRKVVPKRRRRIEEDKGKLTKTKGRVGIDGSSRKKNKNGRGCALLARTSNTEADSDDDGYVPYAGNRSVLAWMIDSGTVPANGKVKYMNKRRTRTMLEGLITRDGILCSCCSKILTVSKFEIHAGSKLNQPYANTLLEESEISLLQCQLHAWKRQKEFDRFAFQLIDITDDDPNDDTCGICGDGGDLMCCDTCPSTFHLSCLDIQMLPPGEWRCTNCLCRFCGLANNSTTEVSSVTGSLLLSCGQCEGKYHQACVSELDLAPIDTTSSTLSFCGQNCRVLFEHLQNLLGVKNDLDAGFSWTLVRRFDDESITSSNLTQRAECNSKVAVALAVMNECFLRIIDRRSGINLIHNVLYNRGSNFTRLSYGGFCTFVLERGDEIISAASIRICGTKVAEMPFIGTRDMYRRQGMCRRLLNVIEVTLAALKIEKLVIPAISELMHTWTVVFGFKPLDDVDKQEMKSLNMLVFPDTGLLQKPLLGSGNNTTKEGGLGSTENDTYTVPNGSLNLCTFDDGTVSYSLEIRDEIGISKTDFSASNNFGHATPELHLISDLPSDAPCKSYSEAVRYKSLETTTDGPSSVDCNVGYHDIPSGGIEPKNPLPCDGLASDIAEVQSLDSVTHFNVPAVDKLPIQHTSDVIGKSLDTPASFQDVSEKTLHLNSGYLGNSSEFSSEVASDDVEVQRHANVTHSSVPTVDKLSIQSENSLHVDSSCMGNLPEFRTEETSHNISAVANDSSLAPVLCNCHGLDVATVLDAHNRNVEASAPDGNLLSCDSHLTTEGARISLENPVNLSCAGADSLEPNLQRSDGAALLDAGKVAVEVTMIKNETCTSCNDSHPCMCEAFTSQMKVDHQVNAFKDVACAISETTNHNGCF